MIKTDKLPTHLLQAGDLAYFETVRSGLVKVKILSAVRDNLPEDDRVTREGSMLSVRYRVTAESGAYYKGYEGWTSSTWIHSRSAISRSGMRILARTVVIPDGGSAHTHRRQSGDEAIENKGDSND